MKPAQVLKKYNDDIVCDNDVTILSKTFFNLIN